MESLKSLVTSRTTQNVAAGSAGGIAVSAMLVAALRHSAPWLLPWDDGFDIAAAGTLGTVVVPWLSRRVAFLRHPDKQNGG
mgnify:CR=1 FL=1